MIYEIYKYESSYTDGEQICIRAWPFGQNIYVYVWPLIQWLYSVIGTTMFDWWLLLMDIISKVRKPFEQNQRKKTLRGSQT